MKPWTIPVAAALLAVSFSVGWGVTQTNWVAVSQKGRQFAPGELQLRQGQAIRIANDDSDFTHHAYVSSETFSFDSGELEPGQTVDVVFSKSGTFTVLCGIHPKMRLEVTVK